MKNLTRLALLAAATGLAATLSAQPADGPRGRSGNGPRGHHDRPPGHPIVRVLDLDQDRVLSAAEIAGAPATILALDADADGTVSNAELHAGRPLGTPPPDAPRRGRNDDNPPPRRNDPVMLALDADGDCALSAAEIANAPTSLAALDLNQDGQLTPDEFRPLPPE